MSTAQNPQGGQAAEHATPEADAEASASGSEVTPPTTDENDRPVDNPSG